jgi:glucosamine--fructose-6-phosphate aminotransferase (isomerizing)
MCGIIGYIGARPVLPLLIDGLRRLEYRGYDSAGIAVINDGKIEIRRRPGKLHGLVKAIQDEPLKGQTGLGHSRWATHGRPTEENAHPHRDCSGRIVVVHNGIIENYLELKRELQNQDHAFQTETDTEVIAHLIEKYLSQDAAGGFETAFRRALAELRGIYALVAMSADEPDKLVSARLGPPIVVGLGDGEYFVASDIPALLPYTRDIFFLGDNEIVTLTRGDRTAGPAHQLGPDPGRKGRVQAFHAQGDLRAAARHSRHHAGTRITRHGPSVPGHNGH